MAREVGPGLETSEHYLVLAPWILRLHKFSTKPGGTLHNHFPFRKRALPSSRRVPIRSEPASPLSKNDKIHVESASSRLSNCLIGDPSKRDDFKYTFAEVGSCLYLAGK
jgi:hypothetical protein